jgi:predicted methyltransferase
VLRTAMAAIQRLLMLAYGAAERSGLLNGPRMRALFETSYAAYKERVEARYLVALRPYVRPGTIVVDVGANIGVFTRRFAEWAGAQGCVIAIEPEARNFARLQAMLAARQLRDRVVAVHAAAAGREGQVNLAVDPLHPGGHHLAA